MRQKNYHSLLTYNIQHRILNKTSAGVVPTTTIPAVVEVIIVGMQK